MRKTVLIMALALAGLTLRAQTPATTPATTNSMGTANTAANPNRPISLEEAIAMALQSNLDIQIARYNPTISRYAISEAYAVYEPDFQTSYNHVDATRPGGFNANTGLIIPASRSVVDGFGAGVGQGIAGYAPSGLTYSFDGRVSEVERFLPSSHEYNSDVGISLRQPLLRGFLIDQSRALIQLSKRDLRISEDELRREINDILLKVEQAYYNLIYARENVKVQATALELASQLLRENRKKVEVGALAPLDEKQAESEVASTRAALIDAERLLSEQQNKLKGLITDKYAEWNAVNLEPMEKLVAVPATLDLQASWGRGLTKRPDLSRLKFELEKAGITLKLRKNQLWPELDLVGSYRVAELNNVGYGRAIGDLGYGRNPTYSYGVQMEIPLGNRAARARLGSAKAVKERSLMDYKKLEQQIMVEIDDAVKLIRSDFERVEATRSARAFAQEALAAEQKKLENGKSTSFLVLQFQRDLTVRSSDEIKALADYNNALAELANREGASMERNHINMK